MENKVAKTRNQKIADVVKLTPEEVEIIKATVAKGFTDTELAYFLNVAKVYQLNPFTKQIWGYKDSKNNIIVFAGRDGFLAKAQKDSRWNGIASDIVREGEVFRMDAAAGLIKHDKDITSKKPILGAYAICKPKGCEYSTIEWADFDTYNKGSNVWKSDPAAMIKKVAESHCLMKAYGISGLAVEEDFDTRGQVVYNIDHEEKPELNKKAFCDELIRKAEIDEDTKEIYENKLADPEITNAELDTMISTLQENQPKQFSIF
jgi:phage recombination protein Bet